MPLCPDWYEPSDRYGIAGFLRNFAPLVLIYAFLPHLAKDNAFLVLPVIPLIGLFIYRLTIVMHDCGHATLFRSPMVNRCVGEFLGAVTGIDFDQFRKRHFGHHRDFGKADDPQGFHYVDIPRMSRSAFVWHVLKPLLGANLRYVLPESYLHPRNTIRMTTSGKILFIVPVQFCLLALISGFGSIYWLALVPAVSAATFGLFLSQLRGMAEHGVEDGDKEVGFVRTHEPNLLDRLLLYDLNFNFHEEHHRYAYIPSCHLPALRDSIERPKESATMWHTVKTLGGAHRWQG